jgi:hypothetical protein
VGVTNVFDCSGLEGCGPLGGGRGGGGGCGGDPGILNGTGLASSGIGHICIVTAQSGWTR